MLDVRHVENRGRSLPWARRTRAIGGKTAKAEGLIPDRDASREGLVSDKVECATDEEQAFAVVPCQGRDRKRTRMTAAWVAHGRRSDGAGGSRAERVLSEGDKDAIQVKESR